MLKDLLIPCYHLKTSTWEWNFLCYIIGSGRAGKKMKPKQKNPTRKCRCVKSLNGKFCLTVTAALPDLPRKCSGSVSVTPRNNKQAFHFRALLTICKAGIMKRSRLVPLRQEQRTDSHLQKEQHGKRGRPGKQAGLGPSKTLSSCGFTWHRQIYME